MALQDFKDLLFTLILCDLIFTNHLVLQGGQISFSLRFRKVLGGMAVKWQGTVQTQIVFLLHHN